MMLICYASDVMGYGQRTLELSNAALHMEQYTNSIEIHPSITLMTNQRPSTYLGVFL